MPKLGIVSVVLCLESDIPRRTYNKVRMLGDCVAEVCYEYLCNDFLWHASPGDKVCSEGRGNIAETFGDIDGLC